jgi:phosphoenolpyruvate-protein phosphotransferase (PTS system enzyme I)
VLKGINASPGICIGKAYHVDREGVNVVVRYAIPENKIKGEIKRFKSAVQAAKHELRAVIENSPPELQKGHILETHVVLLNDKLLYGRTIETIEKEHVNAEWALKSVVNQIRSVFHEMPDPYLKERVVDISHVSNLVLRNLIGAKTESIGSIDKRVILVAHDLSPADTSQINLERIKGFITDLGGKTSHTGIIARSLEIPAVVGLETATHEIHNDDIVIVDGTTGVVIARPSESTLLDYEERREGYERYRAVLTRESHLEAKTRDGLHLDILGNIELPEEVVSVLNYGGDGIGLYRTEFQYLNRNSFPSEEELFEGYKDVIEVMTPRPVTLRTLDINGDKALSMQTGPTEANPALGLRAIRYCLRRPDVFRTQLRAILRAAALGEVRIIFPMIAIRHELLEAKRLLDEAAESLEKDGLPYRRDVPIGIMIEIPAAVVMADLLAREVDFFSIGTNDLIQYALAIDRGNKQVSHLFQPLDPAVLRLIKHAADAGRERGITVGMCGEMASYPLYAPLLLGMGLTELSMNPAAIPAVKRMIRAVSAADSREAAREALKQPSALKVLGVVRSAFGQFMVNHRGPLKA